MNPPRPPTLGQRLLRTVLLPLGVTWIAGTVVSFSELFVDLATQTMAANYISEARE